jgi:phosphoglucosamine mutase
MRKLFGTDGIRGVAGEPPLDSDTLWRIGTALAETGARAGQKPSIVVGRDTRISGESIAQVLQEAMLSSGVDGIRDVGVVSTPGLAYLTRLHRCDLGVMISASHNPYADNGIKVFGPDGYKLSDEQEMGIEELIDSSPDGRAVADRSPTCRVEAREWVRDYVKFLESQSKESLAPLRIGLDVCNGSAHAIAPMVFRELGASVELINDKPDGKNINLNCGSLYLAGLISLVKERQLDFGVAFDGDADRSLFVTASGKVFDGDFVLFALALHFQRNRQLKGNKVVGTIMSNYALERALKDQGIEFLRAAVGDRYVLEMMKEVGANLGGEPSGHVVLRDHHTTGDGVLTAVKLAEIVAERKISLEELGDGFRPYPQVLDGLKVREKIPLNTSPEIARLLKAVEEQLNGSGRLVVRYSGTEPLLRIMAEGEDAVRVRQLVERLKTEIGKLLSAG